MKHTKWSIDDIELTRQQLNLLQKRLEDYSGAKKLGVAFFQSIVNGLKNRLIKKSPVSGSNSNTAIEFKSKNPDFKPYQIRLKAPIGVELPKILHVIPYFVTGGSQQLIVDIIEGLSGEYVHEVALMAVVPQQGYVGVPIHDCSGIRDPAVFAARLQQIKPDIVHVHYYGQWPHFFWHWYHVIFQGAAAYGRPVVENCNIPYMPYYQAGIARYVYVSEYARDTYGVRHMPNQVIYPGSNFTIFHRANTSPDPDTIGMVYRMDGDKINNRAMEPFIKVMQKRPQTKVLIVGGGEQLELFQQQVELAGLNAQFTFTGYVAYEKLADLYRRLAIFVAPVYSESFGQVTPFAMNMGIPVAAYNVGALEEILANTEVLAPGEDAEALSDIIVGLLNDPAKRERIGAFNKARANELFTVETMVEAYRQLYHSVR
ncbi:MAG TPA: glycosyltransferase family 4 protein [Hymenobacter sp.]|jgi:glycosyltransferase involved in cell wall biosynthesis|uniref:glycosyltransferase family 4 protein n=1 Tax=Hymenobacter sp. TaxID=1898978 RepID=UPI002ED7D1E6